MQHCEEVNGENLAEVSRLLETEAGRAAAGERLRQALGEVRAERNFLPTVAVRRVVKHSQFRDLSAKKLGRLLDWTTETVVAWLVEAATDPNHPARQRLLHVEANFYRSLALVLHEWRHADPEQELLWRMVQIAGWEPGELDEMVPGGDLEDRWQAAQAELEMALEEQGWDPVLLENAHIRPPQGVTRMLEWIESEHRPLWEVGELSEVRATLARQARRITPWAAESLVQESLLKMRTAPEIPANSRELAAYTATILYRLALDRLKKDGRLESISEQEVMERLQHQVAQVEGQNPSKRADLTEVVNLATRNLKRDKPELREMLEDWLDGCGNKELSARHEVSEATVKRRRTAIREFYEQQFSELGINLLGFTELSPEQRWEKFYQVMEKERAARKSLLAGEQRALMRAALEAMERDDKERYGWLHEAYLGEELLPTELGERWQISTQKVNERKSAVRVELLRRMEAIYKA